MIVILTKKASKEDIKKAKQEFGDYIKIVAIGGKLHADAEKPLGWGV